MYSFIGWTYECVFYSVQHGKFVNSGFLNGCLCPIYGMGAWLILIFLGNIENMFALFAAGMVVTGVLEYFTSWFLEKMFHQRWWDYTEWAFNINGRVCLLGALAFGTMSVLLVKIINPFTMRIIMGIKPEYTYILTVLAAVLTLTDTIITVKNIDIAPEKLWFVQKQSELVKKYKLNFRNWLADWSENGENGGIIDWINTSENEEGFVDRIKRMISK